MKKLLSTVILAFAMILALSAHGRAEPIALYAAGSLKEALGDVVAAYQKAYHVNVTTKFGQSGLLRQAIEKGEPADVFASADMGHPKKLASSGWGGPVVLFTRNQLCVLAQPEVAMTTESLLDALLNPDIRVGTSTPKADPSGDYAWEVFKKADRLRSGSFASLSQKALLLTGGPTSEKPPEGRNPYGWVMAEKKADVFLTYCTNAVAAKKEVPSLRIVRIPEPLSVGADYGLIVRNGARAEAWKLALYILSPDGQKILAQHGFETVALPK